MNAAKTKIWKGLAISIVGLVMVFSTCWGYIALAVDEQFYADNGIIYFDPCGGVTNYSIGGSAPSALTGGTNEEKVWNYFIARGLTPIAAAGAMGNMVQESSAFDPWAGENGSTTINKDVMNVGFGIIQWTNTEGSMRRQGVMTHLENNGVPLNAADESKMDQALLLELDWLWDGEYGETWQAAVNAETKVGGDASKAYSEDNTGNGSAMVFHSLVERSADGTTGKQERIDSANDYLTKFGNGVVNTTLGSGPGTMCSGTSVGGNSDWRDGNALSAEFAAQVGFVNRGPYKHYFWDYNGCTTMTLWFISEYTTLKYGEGHGAQVVDGLVDANPGLQETDFPTAPAIFSSTSGHWWAEDWHGHTGVVVKVEGNIATVVHTWADQYDDGVPPDVREFEIPRDMSQVKFVNVGDYLK